MAFGVSVLGGARHLTSAGDPTKMSDARDQIFSGILGLIILLASYLILTTINPQLVILKLPGLAKVESPETPGVYICLDVDLARCTRFNADSASLPDDFDTEFQYIHFENPKQCKSECKPEDCNKPECQEVVGQYGAVLHEDSGFRGNCVICLSDSCNPSSVGGDGVSSLHVFLQSEALSGEGVSLYEKKEYNKECDSGDCDRWPVSDGYTKISLPDLNQAGKSIKIENEGRYLAVLFEGTNFSGRCEVFRRSDPDLASNYIGVCGAGDNLGCFRSIIVSPIK